jgi:hypothetical protein
MSDEGTFIIVCLRTYIVTLWSFDCGRFAQAAPNSLKTLSVRHKLGISRSKPSQAGVVISRVGKVKICPWWVGAFSAFHNFKV